MYINQVQNEKINFDLNKKLTNRDIEEIWNNLPEKKKKKTKEKIL